MDGGTVLCATCGFENDANRRFCRNCGAALHDRTASAADPERRSALTSTIDVEPTAAPPPTQSAPPDAGAGQPAAPQPATPQAGAPLPAAPQPALPQPAAPRPAAPTVGSDQSEQPIVSFISDEPSSHDDLGRELFVETMARMISESATPITIGIYGPWGSGKTSFLRQLDDGLARDVSTVHFESWLHQRSHDPVIALAQRITSELELGSGPMRSILRATAELGGEFGPEMMKGFPLVGRMPSARSVRKVLDEAAARRFQLTEEQDRLREHFRALMALAVERSESGRVAVFIDDLDRCQPETVVRILEALKLYLSWPGVVFVIALDRRAAVSALATTYGDEAIADQYLDKIVQMPFYLPPVTPTRRSLFLHDLLRQLPVSADRQAAVRRILEHGASDNPRAAKRIANAFALASQICRTAFVDCDERLVALSVLIQFESPGLLAHVRAHPTSVGDLTDPACPAGAICETDFIDLAGTLESTGLGAEARLDDYVALSSQHRPADVEEIHGGVSSPLASNRAQVMCTVGLGPLSLVVQPRVLASGEVDETATVKDRNLTPCAGCMAGDAARTGPPRPCVPSMVGDWSPASGGALLIDGAPVTALGSFGGCVHGGMLTIVGPGSGPSRLGGSGRSPA